LLVVIVSKVLNSRLRKQLEKF